MVLIRAMVRDFGLGDGFASLNRASIFHLMKSHTIVRIIIRYLFTVLGANPD